MKKKALPCAGPAFHPDAPAMRFDGQLAEGQAQARRHFAPGLAALDLAELLEDAVERLGRDAFARVADTEQQQTLRRLGGGRDGAAGGRELDGVAQ